MNDSTDTSNSTDINEMTDNPISLNGPKELAALSNIDFLI